MRRAIGFAMQEAGLARYATGREHLHMMGRLYGLSRAQTRTRADELLTLFGLEDAADRQVRTYSGGMRRRIDLACGLVHQPRLLFLDEPTTGVDPTSRAALWDELRRLQGEGVSLFLTTHYLEEADRLCDRLAIVDRGVIVARGTPDELKAEVGADVVTVGLADSEAAPSAAEALADARPRAGGGQRAQHRARADRRRLGGRRTSSSDCAAPASCPRRSRSRARRSTTSSCATPARRSRSTTSSRAPCRQGGADAPGRRVRRALPARAARDPARADAHRVPGRGAGHAARAAHGRALARDAAAGLSGALLGAVHDRRRALADRARGCGRRRLPDGAGHRHGLLRQAARGADQPRRDRARAAADRRHAARGAVADRDPARAAARRAHRDGLARPARHARAGGDLRRGLVGHLAQRRAAHAQPRGHGGRGRAHLPALLRLDGVHAARPAARPGCSGSTPSTRSTT